MVTFVLSMAVVQSALNIIRCTVIQHRVQRMKNSPFYGKLRSAMVGSTVGDK